MIWRREEYLDLLTFNHPPREMFVELFGPLVGLQDEWRDQGATADELSLEAFGWDSARYAILPVRTTAITGLQGRVLVDDDRERVTIDEKGRVMRLIKGAASQALPQKYIVETEDDWARIRHWYAFSEDRIDYEALKRLKKAQKEGTTIVAAYPGGLPGGFDEPRELMGEENLCLAFYDSPEMIKDMLDTISDTCLKVFERVSDYVTIDILHVHEDMAGKSGPLIGHGQIKSHLEPYYRRVWEPLKARGARVFMQDSDGNMASVIDDFVACGINCMYPCEPQAGMDAVALREKYPRVAFMGGVDKFALRGTKEDVRCELEYKMGPILKGGGMVFGLDHLIPNGVPLENYRYYVKLGRELLGLEPAEKCPHVRMSY